MAVRITSTGGGIRNGLKMNVDSNCQMEKAITSEAVDSSIPRNRPLPIDSAGALGTISSAQAGLMAPLACRRERSPLVRGLHPDVVHCVAMSCSERSTSGSSNASIS